MREVAAVASILLLLSAGPASAREKVKRERAQVALPILIEAPLEPGRTYSFRAGEMFGAQPARYRSIVSLDAPVAIPGSAAALIAAGEPLVELQASSPNFTGHLYCKAQAVGLKRQALLCLADRDGDGALDQLWIGFAAVTPLVPFPDIRSLRTVTPVRFRPYADQASLAFEMGFYVSGTNPLLGQHHFYPALGSGKASYVLFWEHRPAAMRNLPKAITVGGAEVTVTGYSQGNYQAIVTRPLAVGEHLIVSPYPKRTIYVYVP